jgi:hypothetical protein
MLVVHARLAQAGEERLGEHADLLLRIHQDID